MKNPEEINHNPCNHNLVNLSYVAWHEWANKKTRRGDKQKQCPKCNLWLFKEERGKKP
jgi:hypothetical protein